MFLSVGLSEESFVLAPVFHTEGKCVVRKVSSRSCVLMACAVALCAFAVVCERTNAAIITYELDTDVDGGSSPASATLPWLTATTDDAGGPAR